MNPTITRLERTDMAGNLDEAPFAYDDRVQLSLSAFASHMCPTVEHPCGDWRLTKSNAAIYASEGHRSAGFPPSCPCP
jgi:hypothetical protein